MDRNSLAGRFATGTDLVSVTDNASTLAEDLLDTVKLDRGINGNDSYWDMILVRKIRAALEAAENYLQRDVLSRDYVINWYHGPVYLAGNITELEFTQGDPAVDVSDQVLVRGAPAFSRNLTLNTRLCSSTSPVQIAFTSGFDDIDTIPAAVIAFVLAFVGMLHEVGEVANIGQGKYTVDEIPAYLLDPLAIPGFA